MVSNLYMEFIKVVLSMGFVLGIAIVIYEILNGRWGKL